MRKYHQSAVQIWFLDRDLAKSAEYLTDVALDRTIDGCVAALTCAVFYFAGIRNRKAYGFFFSRERRERTMDEFFPSWPYRKQPAFRYYASRASRWTRACLEHFGYVSDYLGILLDEHEYRKNRRHAAAWFHDWIRSGMPADRIKIPAAGIKKIVLPWKSLGKKYRRADVIEGYRLQYADVFLWEDPVGAYLTSGRDVPEFVIRRFHLDANSMIT